MPPGWPQPVIKSVNVQAGDSTAFVEDEPFVQNEDLSLDSLRSFLPPRRFLFRLLKIAVFLIAFTSYGASLSRAPALA